MPLHATSPFTAAEFQRRQRHVCRELARRDLDGLLMFRQESMYYVTGYATFGYCFFQCLYLGTDGRMTLLTRLPDTIIAGLDSVIEDIRAWHNLPGSNPANNLRDILEEHGVRGERLGIELDAYGLTGLHYTRVQAALTDFCRLEDASNLVTELRVVKSRAELACSRKAGELADTALVEANRLAVPGAWGGDILAAMQGAVFKGDGDYSGNEFILNSGPRAVGGRYMAGRDHLGTNDQLTVEWAGVYRFYHAAMMRTILTGRATKRQLNLHSLALDAHAASVAELKPGNTFGDVYDAYAKVVTNARHFHFTATGYSQGATFPPSWMDWPMFWHGNDTEIRAGMVLFVHTYVATMDQKHVTAPGQSYIVTRNGNEALSKMSMELVVND